MNTDNFIVRKHREDVEKFADRENWNKLDMAGIEALEGKISGLPSKDDDDEFARRFDLIIINLQIALLHNNSTQLTLIEKIKKLAAGLEDKGAIPSVSKQMELILDIQTDLWWIDVTLPILEDVRKRLRDLIQFVDKDSGISDVFTNFEDELGEPDEGHELIKKDANLVEYNKRVQRFVHEHKDHVTIRRLRNNEPISRTDAEALETILFSEDGPISKEAYEKLYGNRPLGVLVRSIVGLDRRAAKEAFGEFLDGKQLHPDQITFLDQIVEYLAKNGIMEPKAMFETPFTHINEQGIAGVFNDDESKKVIRLVRNINDNATMEHSRDDRA